MQLYDFQKEAVRAYGTEARTYQRIILVLPTGGGKTVVAAEIIRRALKAGKRILFFAHVRELVDQAVDKLTKWGVPIESIGTILSKDERSNPAAPVQVASWQTLIRRDKPEADLIVIDECHHAVAKSYRTILSLYPRAKVLGLTATPMRLDGRGLAEAGFQQILVAATMNRLTIEGVLAHPSMWGPGEASRVDLKGVRIEQGDFEKNDTAKRMSKPKVIGRHVTHYEKLGGKHTAVVYACTKLHGKRIARRFKKAGHDVEQIYGDTHLDERRRILKRLDRGERVVVVNVNVLTEGWDCPAVKVCILARPTRSWMLYMQMVGRFLRPWKGIKPIILDHAGNRLRHGPPEKEREFKLVMPRQMKSSEPAPEKECPECGAFVMTGTVECPECEYTFPIVRIPQEVNGKLVKYGMSEEEKGALLATIKRVAKVKGASDTWVRKVYESQVLG